MSDSTVELDRLRAENNRLRSENQKLQAFWEWSRETDRLLFEGDQTESPMAYTFVLQPQIDALRAENERLRVENQELREEKEVPCKLRLFVWEDFCSDYTSGLAFAIAPNLIDAKKMLEAKGFPVSGEEGYWGPVHEFPATQPIAFAVAGGG